MKAEPAISEAELRSAEDFLRALATAGRALDATELRVEAVAAGIAQAALWAAVHRLGGVPGWTNAAQPSQTGHALPRSGPAPVRCHHSGDRV
jgi:hypothetical protein